MWSLLVSLFVLHHVGVARAGYPTMGDEVQAGSVLLPATRRGRYLANIVRRQAVDGTGIKFNKDADRMNAEARKKVDVLSEELLPYIIAEQERRVTLYRRVMTAVQNGENGVTVAEIRNKPPVIIRKGLLYRCPTNRAPVEPDGSGAIRCENNIDPSPIMFDSCLSAEDRELYVAENKFFFCNRHRVEGADLPRNGSAVIGCAPAERTSLNYTSQRCALEDTDDVVVHYRYYPDKTYKFVSELDPEREMCDNWSPCQLGYIFSLPAPDQAAPAIELWHDTDVEDTVDETAVVDDKYVTSTRKVAIPKGYSFDGIGYYKEGNKRGISRLDGYENMKINYKIEDDFVYITLTFDPLKESNCVFYYVRFQKSTTDVMNVDLVHIHAGQRRLVPQLQAVLPGQRVNATRAVVSCERCALRRVMLRGLDGAIRNVDEHKYSLRRLDEQGEEQSVLELDLKVVNPRDMGDYFVLLQNEEGDDESIKALTIIPPATVSLSPLLASGTLREPLAHSLEYSCPGGQLTDVLCNGASAVDSTRLVIKPSAVEFHFNEFEDIDACVYMGVFRVDDNTYRKELAVIDNIQAESDAPTKPVEGKPFSHTVRFSCRDNCTLTQVSVNGIQLEPQPRRDAAGSIGYFLPMENNEVKIGVTSYSSLYAGYYQGVFKMKREHITKNLMSIGIPAPSGRRADGGADGEGDRGLEAELEQEQRLSHTPAKSEESRMEADTIKLRAVRAAASVRRPYERTVSYEGARLLAVRCRGRDVNAGVELHERDVKIAFDEFQDSDSCVYVGLFKVGDTEHNRTLAVIEIMSVASATVAPPAAGELKHEVSYTCHVAKSCKPVEVYINDKVLKSNDVNSGFTVKSKEKMLSNGKEATVYTLHFTIKPFSKEYEGVYQLVVSHGKERITKNIMEVA